MKVTAPRTRRLLALCLLPLLAVPACSIASADYLPLPGPSSSATPGIFAATGAGQFGEAFWFVKRRRRAFLYAAGAIRGAEAGMFFGESFAGTEAFGFVAHATCRRRGHRIFRCDGHGFGRELTLTDFQADPLLSSAALTMRAAGFRHVVRWNGRGAVPDPDAYGAFGGVYVITGGEADRDARASGRLFGRHVAGRNIEFAYLAEGAGGFFFVDPGLGWFSFERDIRLAG